MFRFTLFFLFEFAVAVGAEELLEFVYLALELGAFICVAHEQTLVVQLDYLGGIEDVSAVFYSLLG